VPGLDGLTEVEGPKVELSPLTLGTLNVPAPPPPPVPVHEVFGETTSHQVKETEPVGARPVESPMTVAESVHALPTEFDEGAVNDVERPGVAGVTVMFVDPAEDKNTSSPEYAPATVSEPEGAFFELQEPAPFDSGAVHRTVDPTENVTDPVGVGSPSTSVVTDAE